MRAANLCFGLIILVIDMRKTDQSHDANHVNTGFVRIVEECKEELNLSDHVLAGMFHLWKMEYDQLTRDVGCIMICMSKKLDLIDVKGWLHHGNAKNFAMQHGADEEVATKLVEMLHECEKQNVGNQDDCLRILETAKCFRTATKDLNWMPKAEYVVGEVLTQI